MSKNKSESMISRFQNRDTVTNPVKTRVLSTFQSATSENLVTGSNTDETPENIELSRCHASKAPDEETEMIL